MNINIVLILGIQLIESLYCCQSSMTLYSVTCTRDHTVPDAFGMQWASSLILTGYVTFLPRFYKEMMALRRIEVDAEFMPCCNISEVTIRVDIRRCAGKMFEFHF